MYELPSYSLCHCNPDEIEDSMMSLCPPLWWYIKITLATNTSCEVNVTRLYGHPLCVDSTEVGVLKEINEVGFSGFLECGKSWSLISHISIKVGRNLPHETLKGKLSDEKLCALLVATDLPKSNSSRFKVMRFLDTRRGGLAWSLCGNPSSWSNLFTRSLATCRLASTLFCASHAAPHTRASGFLVTHKFYFSKSLMESANCTEGYLKLLPQGICDKLALYLLGGGWHRDDTRRNHWHLMMSTLFWPNRSTTIDVVECLSPGYVGNNPSAKRKRSVTAILCTSSNEEQANKLIKQMDDLERKREERRQQEQTMKLL